MEPSLTPLLLAIELAFLFFVAARARRLRSPRIGSVFVLLAWIAGYAVLTSALAIRGAFVSEHLLPWAPGLWLQLVTVGVCVGPVVGLPRLRTALRGVVDATPWHWWARFHVLRIAALGTLYKALAGEFPGYFALLVGVPDLAFGISALWLARRARQGRLGERAFLAWNAVGVLVIVPAAPILLQLGLPGPLYVFQGPPDARAVFTFPMSIAPMIGVPLFVLTNLYVAWRLRERRSQGVPAAPKVRGGLVAAR